MGQVRQSESRLSQDHIYEEEQEYSGHFRGVLPTHRTFEFLNEDNGEVISGKIDFAIKDANAINNVLNRHKPISGCVRDESKHSPSSLRSFGLRETPVAGVKIDMTSAPQTVTTRLGTTPSANEATAIRSGLQAD